MNKFIFNENDIFIIENIYTTDLHYKRHLLDLGFVKGNELKIKKISIFHNPIIIEINGSTMCVRKNDLIALKLVVKK